MNSRLQRWWLWGCFAATLLASWAGGFGVTVTAVFIGIYLTGLVLIGPDEPEAEAVDALVVDETDAVVVDETDAVVVDEADAVVVDEADAVVVDEADAEPYPDDDESETAQTDTTTDTASEGDSDATLEPSDSSR